MTLFRATINGNIPMTAQEEAEFMADQAVHNSLPNKKTRLRQRVNAEKDNKDLKGINVNGVKYSTNFSARLQLANAMVFIGRNPGALATIEDRNGDIQQLDAAALGAVYDAVNAYIDSVALAKKAHFEAIKLLRVDNIDSYDINTLWP